MSIRLKKLLYVIVLLFLLRISMQCMQSMILWHIRLSIMLVLRLNDWTYHHIFKDLVGEYFSFLSLITLRNSKGNPQRGR